MCDRKTQILDAAADLLQSRSYTSFSYQDLSDRLGITKASIHHHFASKEALGQALAERYLRDTSQRLAAIDADCDEPWDRLRAYLEMPSEILRDGDKICPVGAIGAESNVVPKTVLEPFEQLCDFAHTWLVGVLEDGKRRGVMGFRGSADDRAVLIQSAIQGALQLARGGKVHRFEAVIRSIEADLKTT